MDDEGDAPRSGRRRIGAWLGRPLTIGILGVLVVALATGGVAVTDDADDPPPDQPPPAGHDGDRFTFLAAQDSNYCSLDQETVLGYPADQRIQGSCCNPMDPDKYQHQLDGLNRYEHIPQIPQDPYDIEAGLAQELLGYNQTITLTPEEKASYDAAMGMTEDGGPCCCQCWRWYMTEGLSKFLITRHQMDAEEVAEIADLTNGCGGHLESEHSSP